MKLQFDASQTFQLDAINAAVDLFQNAYNTALILGSAKKGKIMGKDAKAVNGKSESFEKTLFKAADKPERFTCLDVAFKNNDHLKKTLPFKCLPSNVFIGGNRQRLSLR